MLSLLVCDHINCSTNVHFIGGSAPIWGMISDKKPPKVVTATGCFLIVLGFSLMGPLPFLPMKKSIPLMVAALLFHGDTFFPLTIWFDLFKYNKC